ncbi:MAG TPA: hypothetical protein VNZ22_17325 [Bacillota bacterium]|nr:hypothetical protein [Bacillota bacterium]
MLVPQELDHEMWLGPAPKVAQPSRAAIFVPGSRPDFLPMWLTRHYGVFCLGWPGINAKTFPAGHPIRCQYRVWGVHRGNVSSARLRKAYEAYNGKASRLRD